jgi:aminopeptidase N
VRGDQVGQLAQQRAALRRRQLRPLAGGQRLVRGAHGAIRILRIARGDQRPRLAEKGIVRFEILAGGRLDPFAADPHLVLGLALERASRVAHVRYALCIRLMPRAPAALIELRIAFALHGHDSITDDLWLDYRPPRGGVMRGLVVNGSAVARGAQVNDHVVLPARRLRAGENSVSLQASAPLPSAGGALIRFVDADDGAEYVYTLFVPCDASTVFPCFDQPDLKARFTLDLVVDRGWTGVGNAPLLHTRRCVEGRRLSFAQSEPISTYAFAFAAGPFARLAASDPDDPTRLFIRRSRRRAARRVSDDLLRLNRAGMRYFERYLGHRFAFAKYDLVLLPEFPYRGMEHAGATFLREEAVLLPPSAGSAERLQRAQLLLHETAHQWLGDLVTMRWFDDLWIKEGFANFLAYKAGLRLLRPAEVRVAFLLLKSSALETDRSGGANALHRPLDDLTAAKALYGTIVYGKAPAMLQQLELLYGALAFRRGVRTFVRAHAYGCAGWRDLIRALEAAFGQTLDAWARAWLLRPGAPLVRTRWRRGENGDGGALLVEQRTRASRKWSLRTALRIEHASGKREHRAVDLAATRLSLPCVMQAAPRFLLGNAGDQAYGVFLLDPSSRREAAKRLRRVRDPLLRAQIWEDAWYTLREGECAPDDFIALAVAHLEAEDNETLLDTVLRRLAVVVRRWMPPLAQARHTPAIERLFEAGMARASLPSRLRSWRRAWFVLVRSPSGLQRLRALLDQGKGAGVLALDARERIDATAALIARGAQDRDRLIERLVAGLPEAAATNAATCMHAAIPTRAAKRGVLDQWLRDPEVPEGWIDRSLDWMNDSAHAALTLPLLGRALQALDRLARVRKIFFLDRWIMSFVGGQHTPEALARVDCIIAERRLAPELGLKLLEARDGLVRTIRIRQRFGA